MPKPIIRADQIKVGDYFEDCNYHPCVCTEVNVVNKKKITCDDDISGISLINGNRTSCSLTHCGPRQLTFEEAMIWKKSGPTDVEDKNINRWWDREKIKYVIVETTNSFSEEFPNEKILDLPLLNLEQASNIINVINANFAGKEENFPRFWKYEEFGYKPKSGV